jgi:hypothetical protein
VARSGAQRVPTGLFVGVILALPALGISMVKPCVVGTTARASKENVRSIGYSIYYTMVNIGGAAGPVFCIVGSPASGRRKCLSRRRAQRLPDVFCRPVVFSRAAQGRRRASAFDRNRRPKFLRGGRQLARLVLPVLAVALLLRIGLFLLSQISPFPGGSGSRF